MPVCTRKHTYPHLVLCRCVHANTRILISYHAGVYTQTRASSSRTMPVCTRKHAHPHLVLCRCVHANTRILISYYAGVYTQTHASSSRTMRVCTRKHTHPHLVLCRCVHANTRILISYYAGVYTQTHAHTHPHLVLCRCVHTNTRILISYYAGVYTQTHAHTHLQTIRGQRSEGATSIDTAATSLIRVQELCESRGGRPDQASGFRGRKAILNRASALVSTCPQYVNRHPRTLSNTNIYTSLTKPKRPDSVSESWTSVWLSRSVSESQW